MLLYDISTDVLTAKVYDGDPTPNLEYIKSCDNGDDYNLSVLKTCMHTGTHIDSPYHFDSDGKKIEDMKLSVFYGKCTVVTIKGILTGEDMERLLPYCKRRLILHGDGEAYLSYSAAVVLADSDIQLIGTVSTLHKLPQSIADFAEKTAHRITFRFMMLLLYEKQKIMQPGFLLFTDCLHT